MTRAPKIPTEMRAAAIDRYGSPDVVHTEVLPVPKLGRKEVLLNVAIAGVGTWDPEIVDGSIKDVKISFRR
jgi:D-arabinose 1-dehydrogenase-like Zn-dependent alcohol dehydrogenase